MRGFWGGIIGGAVGGLAAFTLFKVAGLPRFDLGATWMALLLPAIVVVFYLTVAIHEAGHLLAGGASGFRPCLFIVGPLKLERVSGRWRMARNRNAPLFGGLVAGVPDNAADLRRRMIRLIAGGPAASLVSGLLGVGMLVILKQPGPRVTLSHQDAFAYIMILGFTLMSLLIAFIALMPNVSQGFTSDGGQILKFLKNGPEVEAEVALIAVSTSSLAGTRPREWDATMVARALTIPPGSPKAPIAFLLAHLSALDRGDVEEARRLLQSALAGLDQLALMWRTSVLLEAASFASLHDHDPIAGRRFLEQAGPGALISEGSRAWAEATVLHAEGAPGADERLDTAEAGLPNAIDKGGAVMMAEAITALRQLRAHPI